jgi:DMSO/TMAO reductase YedYZ molybdopterin-dependent catalytic subunit
MTSRDWPVRHDGDLPRLDLDVWRFRVWGQVAEERAWSWSEFARLPRADRTADLRCDEGWRLVGRRWSGVPSREILSRIRLKAEAAFVMVHAHGGYRANLSLYAFASPDVIFADSCDGSPLSPEHGWPLRLILHNAGARKSVKWVRGLEFLNKDWPGTRETAERSCGAGSDWPRVPGNGRV